MLLNVENGLHFWFVGQLNKPQMASMLCTFWLYLPTFFNNLLFNHCWSIAVEGRAIKMCKCITSLKYISIYRKHPWVHHTEESIYLPLKPYNPFSNTYITNTLYILPTNPRHIFKSINYHLKRNCRPQPRTCWDESVTVSQPSSKQI